MTVRFEQEDKGFLHIQYTLDRGEILFLHMSRFDSKLESEHRVSHHTLFLEYRELRASLRDPRVAMRQC